MTAASKPDPLIDITKGLHRDLDAVERQLKKIGSSPNPLIAEIHGYLFEKSGKRIRPALLILCSKLCGYKGPHHIFWAALVEIIHTASLIHDDIIDNSHLRRGRDTVHARWGPNITVLLGDFLYIQSVTLALKTRKQDIIDLLADVTARMIEGELLEYSMSGDPGLTEERYLEILDKKTARLFSAACQIGGWLAGTAPRETQKLREFGRNLGLSFQIVDDLLDYTGDAATLGKPVLADLREGRVTLPLIHALRLAKGDARDEFLGLIKNRTADRKAVKRILGLIDSAGALDYSFNRAAAFAQKAKDVLAAFPASAPRESLVRMVDLVLRRKT